MSFIKSLFSIFKPKPYVSRYQSGRDTVDSYIKNGELSEKDANHLYALSDGGFNETTSEHEFDKGVRDRLYELGFDDPEEAYYR